MENTGVVLLTDGAELLPVQRIADAFFHGSVSADATTITECLSLGGKLPFESASLDLVIAVLRKAEHFGNQWFEEFSRVLKPSGKILIQIYVNPIKSKELNSSIERQLLLSGFIELQTLQRESLLPCRDSIPVIIEAKRPSWMTGSSFTLKNARKALPKIHNDDELANLIDEDSLITKEDYMKPQLPASSGDCEAGSIRKACKNCTCGRAEANAKAERLSLTADQLSNPRSACGSCGLGDAFRCGGCPYRGLPPLKHGEKSNFLVTDI